MANTTAFNDSSIVRKLTYDIDGEVLDPEDVVSTELYWYKDVFSVTGRILLKDTDDGANLYPLNSANTVQIYSEDGFDDYYFKTFHFTNIKETKASGRHKVYEYELIDKLAYKMMNTYVGKSYAGKLLSDIIADYFGYFGWAELLDPGVALELLPTEKLHEFFIVPQNVNFLQWLREQLDKEGYTMYQTRKKVVIGAKKDDLAPVNLEKIEWDSYSQLHYLAEHPFKIHDILVKFNPDFEQATQSPLQDTTHFDFATKTMISTKSSMEEVFGDFKVGTTALGAIQKTVGEKLGTQTNDQLPMIKSGMQKNVQKNTILDIIVSGNYIYNEIYKNADIVLSGSLENLQGQKEGDIRMSGIYTIVAVTDKYISDNLTQKLTLERANFQEA